MTIDPPSEGSDRYLRLDDVRAELRRRSVRSGYVQIGSQAIKVVIMVATGMTLARLIAPSSWGVYSMATSFVALVMSVQYFGLPQAISQRAEIVPDDIHALFWVSLRLSALVALGTALFGPLVARFYGVAALTAVIGAMSIGVFATNLTVVHRSILVRQLKFERIAAIDVGALATSVVLAIAAAWAGAGYWALALQFVAVEVVRSVALWLAVEWRPGRATGRGPVPGLGPLLRYGWQFSATRAVEHAGRNLDRVLVGVFQGPTAVGLYDNAFRWAHYPTMQVFQPLATVAVSSLSRAREASRGYAEAIGEALLPVLTVVLPALAFMALEPRVVILAILGDQWVAAIPLFRLLCVAAIFHALGKATTWLYLSTGQTARQLRWTLLSTPVIALAVALGIQWGAYGVAIGYTTARTLLLVPQVAFCLTVVPLSGPDYVGIVWRPAVAAGLAAAALAVAGGWLPWPEALLGELAVKLAAYGVAFGTIGLALPGGREDARRLLRLARELRGA